MKVSEAKLIANRKNALLGGRPAGSIEETTVYKKAFTAYVLKRLIDNEGPIIDAMLEETLKGNVQAFTALRDTAIGKPSQAVEIGGTDGSPLIFMPLELIQKHALSVIEGEEAKTIDAPKSQ